MNTMNEISLASLMRLCWRNLKWLVLGLVIGALLMFAVSTFVITPTYQSSADLFVTSYTSFEDGSISSAALAGSQALTYSYAEVLKNNVVLKAVAEDVNNTLGTNLSSAKIKGMISFTIPEDTNILRISCVSTSQTTAEAVCNSLGALAPIKLKETCEVGTCNMIGPATKAIVAGPNTTLNTMLGAMVGLILVVAVVVIRWMTDTTIKGKEDLSERTDVPVLAEIPAFENDRRASKGKKRAGRVRVTETASTEAKEEN